MLDCSQTGASAAVMRSFWSAVALISESPCNFDSLPNACAERRPHRRQVERLLDSQRMRGVVFLGVQLGGSLTAAVSCSLRRTGRGFPDPSPGKRLAAATPGSPDSRRSEASFERRGCAFSLRGAGEKVQTE